MAKSNLLVKSAFFFGLFLPANALAQGNYRSSPLGGRSALLGGTGVALGVDEATPFINPAGLANFPDRTVALSSKFLRYSERHLVGWHQPRPDDSQGVMLEDTSLTAQGLGTVPDTACYFFGLEADTREPDRRAGRQRFAICLGRAEESTLSTVGLNFSNQSASHRVRQTQTVDLNWTSSQAGPSWGIFLTDRLAVGASLFATRTKFTQNFSVISFTENRETQTATSAFYNLATSGYCWDLVSHFGITYRLTQSLTLGMSIAPPSLHLVDAMRAGFHTTSGDTSLATRYWAGDGDLVVKPPTHIALGIGLEKGDLRLELDSDFHLGSDNYITATLTREELAVNGGLVTSTSRGNLVFTEAARPVVNFGLGAEYFISRKVGIAGGLASDFSALLPLRPEDTPETRLVHSRLSAFHASLGTAVYTSFGDVLLGVRGSLATGQIGAVNAFSSPPRMELVDQKDYAIMLILAGRVNLQAVAQAARDITDVMDRPKPKPTPSPPSVPRP